MQGLGVRVGRGLHPAGHLGEGRGLWSLSCVPVASQFPAKALVPPSAESEARRPKVRASELWTTALWQIRETATHAHFTGETEAQSVSHAPGAAQWGARGGDLNTGPFDPKAHA